MTEIPKLTKADLHQFTGSERWYRHSLNRNVLFTDGAKFVADGAAAYWLLDDIALRSSPSCVCPASRSRSGRRPFVRIGPRRLPARTGISICSIPGNTRIAISRSKRSRSGSVRASSISRANTEVPHEQRPLTHRRHPRRYAALAAADFGNSTHSKSIPARLSVMTTRARRCSRHASPGMPLSGLSTAITAAGVPMILRISRPKPRPWLFMTD
jgi:hypothetical protein